MEFNEHEIKRNYMLNVQRFTYDRSNYLKRNGYQVDGETRKAIKEDYALIIKMAIDHLRKIFPEGFIHGEGTIDFTLEGAPEEVQTFLGSPSISCTIKPAGEDCSCVMSFEDGKLVESLDAQEIPGLPRKYQNEHLNQILVGRNIVEVKILLDRLGVLPDNNLIDMVLEEYKMRMFERRHFARAVVSKLLLANNEDDLARAYLLDYFAGASYDFEEVKKKGRTK